MAERFTELSDGVITAIIKDQNGDPIPGSDLTVLTLTLVDVESRHIINAKDGTNILVSPLPVDELGNFTLRLDAEDNEVLNRRRQIERHRAIVHFEWADGKANEQIEIEVQNISMIGGSPDL